MIKLDFYSSTNDPDISDFDRRKLNYTLICYPEHLQSRIFHPDTVQLGLTRPTESNPQNLNPWSIQWNNLSLVTRHSDLNIQIFENQCFSSNIKRTKNKELIHFDVKTKIFNISEQDLEFNNETIYFLLIVRHLIDGRQLIARYEVNKQISFIFDTTDLSALEEVMGNLDDLAAANPTKAVQLITGLADKLNEMSGNAVSKTFCLNYLFDFKIEHGRCN